MENKKILKNEKINIDSHLENILDSLGTMTSNFDERIIKKIGKAVGFKGEDAKIYKLVGIIIENYFNDMINSINHINKREIGTIGKKLIEAKEDEKIPMKKFINLQNNLMSDRILTLKEIVNEINKKGIKINKMELIPDSFLTKDLLESIKKEDKK